LLPLPRRRCSRLGTGQIVVGTPTGKAGGKDGIDGVLARLAAIALRFHRRRFRGDCVRIRLLTWMYKVCEDDRLFRTVLRLLSLRWFHPGGNDHPMTIPTEPIGSIPRPANLLHAIDSVGNHRDPSLEQHYDDAIRDTVEKFEATGSPVITDGEQRKYHNFWTYSVHGARNTAPDGFRIPFIAGHVRRMPRLTSGPFRYQLYADEYLQVAQRYATRPVKQAVISPSALSLMYPAKDIDGYSRQEFIDDLLREHVTEIRRCLELGAHNVQIDFTEGRLAVKLDPTGALLNSFVALNNLGLSALTSEERSKVGVHTCPGGDRDSTHSADVDYSELLPALFELQVRNFYIALAGERDRDRVLRIIKRHVKPNQRVFVGVVSPIDPRIDTPEEVRDRVLQAARYLPPEQLGTTDDCGFSPFCDDTSTTREVAFAKIRARVEGTHLAAHVLGNS
jgi:5-methyltetrahydropteroyltriglutamate--homocysteine methyltransferase